MASRASSCAFLADGLIELRLIGPRVDLREQVTRLHVLAFGERHLLEFAIHARLDGYRVERLDRPEAVEVDRHVLLLDRTRHDRHGQVWAAARPAPVFTAAGASARAHATGGRGPRPFSAVALRE